MTRPRAGTAGPLPELVTFIQHAVPGLQDGRYRLRIGQEISDSDGAPITPATIAAEYSFAVTGDRFRLSNPADVLYGTFPDDAATGEFSTVLPHAVFSAPTFPWARSPLPSPAPAPPPGRDTDTDVPTWLAVLLLDDADVTEFPGLSLKAADATVGDLLPTGISESSTLGDRISYFRHATDRSDLEPADDITEQIKVVDLPLALFWQVAPSTSDLTLMAHVRRVSLMNKPTIARISDQGTPVGDFAVVVGNRLPADGRTSTAHLVSVEGMAELLPTDGGQAPVGTRYAGTDVVRLAVLKSWSFTATGQTATFVDTLLGLNGGQHDPSATTLSYPATSANPAVAAGLGLGYVALDHDLRDRGGTVSWYRGPLAPGPVQPDRIRLPLSSADQAMCFDPTSGMLDVSYAAAWTLGRLLALQDSGFASGLYQWKRGLTRQVVDAVEVAVLQAGLTAASAPAAPPAANTSAALARIPPAVLRAGDAAR